MLFSCPLGCGKLLQLCRTYTALNSEFLCSLLMFFLSFPLLFWGQGLLLELSRGQPSLVPSSPISNLPGNLESIIF